jgi:acyl carrier protein
LQRAGLTAEKFIPDGLSGRAGARLYRSGDVGRYLAGGELEYRGRVDQQVKVRGYRIELGEIEAVLGAHAAVAQCVVSVHETESGDRRLVAYVVSNETGDLNGDGKRLYRLPNDLKVVQEDWPEVKQLVVETHDINGQIKEVTKLLAAHGFKVTVEQDPILKDTEIYNVYAVHPSQAKEELKAQQTFTQSLAERLRIYLAERLPEYMVPAHWMVLDELPLTASGKVDRAALPAPEKTAPISKQSAPPRTVTEEIVAGIWSEVLEIKQVGIQDNFFDLGGHSLLATQVISRAREAFGVDLQLRSLFEGPTVSSLSRSIEQLRLTEKQLIAPPIVPRGEVDQIPLSFAQQRLWFLDQLEPNNPFYNVPAGVRLNGELNIEALERTLSEVVRRHEVLRTSFINVAGEPRQVIGAATKIRLPVCDLSDLPATEREQEAARLAAAESREPFNLSYGPLPRARLLRLAADEHVLLVTMHHIVSDGWSMGVLVREVSALYEAYCAGAESPLPELAIQYADFAVWQRQWLSGTVLEAQLSYWREQLRGLSTLELPTDRVRPAVQSYMGATAGFALDQEDTAALRELSRREGATMFMVLLAAFQVLLSRYSGQSDIVVGTDVANRNQAETEGLIGFFVNELVLRTELSGASSFVELLQRVREVCLKAYEHQDVPFEKLVEEQPERDLSRTPLFQVKLVFQNASARTLHMQSLSVSSFGSESQSAKYDLLLALEESDSAVSGALQYSTDLFNQETVESMLGNFKALLASIIANPQARPSEMEILSEAEKEQEIVKRKEREAANKNRLKAIKRSASSRVS